MSRPLLAITFPNHWSIKNLMHSGVVAGLQRAGVEIQGWAHPTRIESLSQLTLDLGLEPIEWLEMPDWVESTTARRVRHLQKSLLFERHSVETERWIQRSGRGGRSRSQTLLSAVVRACSKGPWAEGWSSRIAARRWELTPSFTKRLGRKPDLLFATNPVDFREDALVKTLMLEGVPAVTMVPSWDNLTSKGVLFTKFKEVYVWNDAMAEETQKLYPHYSREELPIIGVPRFQAYEDTPVDRVRFLLDQGLDPARQTVLFANTATRSFPDQPAVAGHLVAAVESGELGGAQLLVRLHPHDDPEPYRFLMGRKGVAVWPDPDAMESAFGVTTVPPVDDLALLAKTLRSVDVCVNSASTIALDAAACDVPILSVAYDGDRTLDDARSVRSFYRYTHQKPLLKSGGTVLCPSREALLEECRLALARRSLRSEERAELAKIATPGRPADHLVNALLRQLSPSLPLAKGA